MARTIWTGSLSFGLVNVPVGLYSATEDKSIRFNQFQAGTADRVRNRRVNERTGEEVDYHDIVKGYDLGTGEFVIVTPDEIASVAPGKSRNINVTAFVDLADIDPVYFEKPYFLAPHGANGGDRAYALLLEAMTVMKKVAIATFVMRDREYLAAVRPYHGVLVLETLLRADEVRDPLSEIDTLPVESAFDQRELDMAELLIDSMAAPWDPEAYVDTYRERLTDLIEQKRQGKAVVVEHEEERAAPVVNLLEALEASVSAARGSGARASGAGQRRTASATRPARATRRSGSSTPSGPSGPAKRAKVAGTSGATRSVKTGAAASGDLSKADLLRKAADLGVAGRTKMSREELEKAVRAASSGRRRRAS
ncbi:MAG TPA: Ku protein [Acidimicrobiales bacterium]|nr:Ku protein [Acidimicrobiales bacterium]